MENEKSAQSHSENPVWLTELTDAEMEATAGGLLTSPELTDWLNGYKANTLNIPSVVQKLKAEVAAGDLGADLEVAGKWLNKLPKKDKKLITGLINTYLGK
jgi:hypothetical protein